MKFGEFLRQGGRTRQVNLRAVTFKATGQDENLRSVTAEVPAVMAFVDEDRRETIRVEAAADLDKRYQGKQIPAGVTRDEEIYRLLFEALRDPTPNESGSHGRLFDNLTELRTALVLPEVRRLSDEYDLFLVEEFPPRVSQADFDAMVEDAKKNSASDLLSKYGFEKTVKAMAFLAVRSG